MMFSFSRGSTIRQSPIYNLSAGEAAPDAASPADKSPIPIEHFPKSRSDRDRKLAPYLSFLHNLLRAGEYCAILQDRFLTWNEVTTAHMVA